MPVETAATIDELNASNPPQTDTLQQADDHLRLIKAAVKGTFPAIVGANTVTTEALDALQTAYAAGQTFHQAGQIGLFLMDSTPAGGWLPLDGSTYDYDDYPALGEVLGAEAGGTFTLPDCYTTGRFLRSNAPGSPAGTLYSNQNKTHNHAAVFSAGATDFQGSHAHNVSVSGSTTATVSGQTALGVPNGSGTAGAGTGAAFAAYATSSFGGISVAMTSTGGTDSQGNHAHNVTGTVTNTADGGDEARPECMMVGMFIKT
jgi:hypothetical protein